MLLAALCAALVLALTPAVMAQQDVDCDDFGSSFGAQQYFDFVSPPGDPNGLDADGDGLACEDGGGAAQPAAPTTTQYTDPEMTSFEFDPEADCSTQALINANPFGCFIPSPETVGSEFTAATTQDAVNRGLQTQAQACEQPVYLASIFAANCGVATDDTPSEVQPAPTTMTTATPALPATGGLPLVPMAGASLLVLGVTGYAIKRRVS